MISLNKLRHFVVLARTGSYVRAAELVHLSQPALSRSIQSLEQFYGVVLFDRGRAGVELTRTGEEILERAETLLHNATSLSEYLTESSAGMVGTVRFQVGPQLADLLLDPLVRHVATSFPQAKLSIGSGSVNTMRQQLLRGEIDFYIGHYDKTTEHDRIRTHHLGESGATFLVGPAHPLRGKPGVTASEIGLYPRICGTAWNESLPLRVPRDLRDHLRATIEIDNLGIAKRIVRESNAVLIGTPTTSDTQLDILDAAIEGIGPTPIGLHHLDDRTPTPLTTTIIETVIRFAAPHYSNMQD